jgi:hypothetical protein
MDWGEMKTEIRLDLKDTGTTQKFSDATLYLYWKDAVRDYSRWFPLVTSNVALSGSGTGPYTLPSDYLNDILVQVPVNRFLEERRPRPGVEFLTQAGKPFYYWLMGGSLYLDTSPISASDEVLLTYEAMHSIPTSESDDADEVTIPDEDLELPRLYVMAKAYGQQRSRQASLDRFKTRVSSGNTRQDNPLEIEVNEIMQDYHRMIADRIPGGVIMLSRPGRRR